MIKLKRVLFERKTKENLESLLKNEYTVPNQLLIRGSNNVFSGYKEFEIRKNREPRDTSRSSNDIIAALEDAYYPTRPKRRESKFATVASNWSFASKFGRKVNYVFPHKSANIVSFPEDSIDYVTGLAPGYARFVHQFLKKEEFPLLYEFVDVFTEIKKFDMFFEQEAIEHEELYRFIKKNWIELKKEVRKLKDVNIPEEEEIKGSKAGIKAGRVLKSYQSWVEGFEKYFSKMIKGVPENKDVKEVMFDGPKYLSINVVFFQENFEPEEVKQW